MADPRMALFVLKPWPRLEDCLACHRIQRTSTRSYSFFSVDIKSILPLEPFSVSFQGSHKSIHISDSMLRLEGEPTMPRIRYIRQDIADLSTRLAHPDSVLYLYALS